MFSGKIYTVDTNFTRLFTGAHEAELDRQPWLNTSNLLSMTGFICSLIIYRLAKKRSRSFSCPFPPFHTPKEK